MNNRIKDYLLISCMLVLSFGCKTRVGDRQINNTIIDSFNEDRYPMEIDSLALNKLYDKSRWFIYCGQSYNQLIFKKQTGIHDSITYGMLPLIFDRLQINGDTVEIDWLFYYKGKRVDGKLVENVPAWGTVFKKASDKVLEISTRTDVGYFGYECPPNDSCPGLEPMIQKPEIINYIKQNKNKIDPWFRKEAIKRGLINE
jgi:hypothetical protein